MQLELLKLKLNDADLRQALTRLVPPKAPLKDLSITFTPEGIVARGRFTGFPPITFEALVRVVADGTVIGVHLASLDAGGPMGGVLRGIVTKLIADKLKDVPGVEEAKGGVTVNANALLLWLGLASRVSEMRLTHGEGETVAEISGSLVVEDVEKIQTLKARKHGDM